MAYNEVENLEDAVAEIAGALSLVPGDHEIVVIDDGSTDGTGALADDLANRPLELLSTRQGRVANGVVASSHPANPSKTTNQGDPDPFPTLRVVHHPENLGLGGAYRTGFREARGRFVMFYPADSQFPARFIAPFRRAIDHADMVLGFRPGRRESWVGEILSAGERLLYFALLGPMPRFHGLVMFRRSLLETIPLHSEGRGWAVMMEFILRTHRAGYRIAHLPIEIRPRARGASKVNNLPTIWANLKQMVALRKTLRKR